MAEKIDRLFLISSSGKRKLKPMRFRYISKSILANCNGDGAAFEYVNFRGAHFTKSSFKKSVFKGCDFWGTTFKKCKFRDTIFQDCVFQGCKFQDCDFTGSSIQYSAIVNTNLAECNGINPDITTWISNKYPEIEVSESLLKALEVLKNNELLRKTKVLWISDKKLNNLNLFLLKRKYGDGQIESYFEHLSDKEIRILTTYGSLSFGLRKYIKRSII